MVVLNPAAPAWEKVAHHFHLYVLPVVGGASLLLGCLAAVGMSSELPRLLPLVLIAVGAFSLVGSVASHLCIPRAKEPGRDEPKLSPTPAASETSNAVPVAPERGHASSRSPLRPHSGIGRATLAELSHVEDELWRRWATPRSVPLGAPLAGPVPETAYTPARVGACAPFADRDRDVIVLSDSRASRAGSPAREPDVLAPPTRAALSSRVVSSRPPTAPRADISLSAREATTSNETLGARGFVGAVIPLLSGRSSEFLDMDTLDHPASLASINPILPRLSATAVSEGTSVTKSRPDAHRGICSECSRRLMDFRAWVECRVCRRPMCRECLQRSFSTGEGGSCSECRASRNRSSARHRQEGRESGPAAGQVRSREASPSVTGVRVSRARPGPT